MITLSSQVGETTWAKEGRFTGVTEISLTAEGITHVSSAASKLVGVGKLLDPTRLRKIIVSPRKRALQTLDLLLPDPPNIEILRTEQIAEWNYGEYEGLKDNEIRDLRKQKGLDVERDWDIWRDGCEAGEYDNPVA